MTDVRQLTMNLRNGLSEVTDTNQAELTSTIEIIPVNDAPILEGMTSAGVIANDEPLLRSVTDFNLLDPDQDYEDFTITLQVQQQLEGASFSVQEGNGVTLNEMTGEISYNGEIVAVNVDLDLSITPTHSLTGVILQNDGTTIRSNTSTGWGNAGTFSNEAIIGNGYVSATSGRTDKGLFMGLSADDPDQDFDTIDYAFFLTPNARYEIRENGAIVVSSSATTSYTNQDVFKVERVGTTIQYLVNDQVVYTSSVSVDADVPLHMDTAFNHLDGHLHDVTMASANNSSEQFIFNANATQEAVEAVASAISYSGPEQGMVMSVEDGDGLAAAHTLSFTAGAGAAGMSGFTLDGALTPISDDEDNLNQQTLIAETITINEEISGAAFANGQLMISLENSQSSDQLGFDASSLVAISGTDVSVEGVVIGTIDGINNGEDGNPLVINFIDDSNIVTAARVQTLVQALSYQSDTDAPVTDVRQLTMNLRNGLSEVTDTNQAELTSTIEIIPVNDAPILQGTASADVVANDESLLGTVTDFNLIDPDQDYNGLSIRFAVQQVGNANLLVNDVNGVVFDADSGAVYYNGELVAQASGLLEEALTYSQNVNVQVDDTTGTLSRTSGSGWGTAGAFSDQSFTGDGSISVSVGNTDKGLSFGLSAHDDDQDQASIDYGINIKNNGNANIVENGVIILQAGTYATSDVFKIERDGLSIKYYKNDVVLHESSIDDADVPLHFDTAFNHEGGSLNIVQSDFSDPYYEVEFNANATQQAVDAVASAISYSGPEQDIVMNVEDGDGLAASNSLIITAGSDMASQQNNVILRDLLDGYQDGDDINEWVLSVTQDGQSDTALEVDQDGIGPDQNIVNVIVENMLPSEIVQLTDLLTQEVLIV